MQRCKLFMKCCTLSSANSTAAREFAADHGMALEPFSANGKIGKIKSGKQNTVKRYTPNSATPIGANTMFLQIGKYYVQFLALQQFYPILPTICAQVAAKCLCKIQDGVPLKLKILSSALILKHYPTVNTTFDPP